MENPLLELGALTDPGLGREQNEDFYGYYAPADPGVLENKGNLYVVADGMGGYQAGEVASQYAVRRILELYYAYPSTRVAETLTAAFQTAHQEIRQEAVRRHAPGMGTTAVAAVVLGDRLVVANVGDSLAYLIRNGQIRQLAEEHSWVAMALAQGLITPEQAVNHPNRNVITRSLGMEKPLEVFVSEEIPIRPGDTLLLCTDGLSNLLSPEEMAAMASTDDPPQEVARKMVDLARTRGAPDNVTALVVRVGQPAPRPLGLRLRAFLSSPRAALALGTVVFAAVLLTGLLLLLPGGEKPSPWATAQAGTQAALAGTQNALQTATAQGTDVARQYATIAALQTRAAQEATETALAIA
ncbi:MAG: protein phosphatase 2C domain-containing protein, partial [Chloroflexia bacterium]